VLYRIYSTDGNITQAVIEGVPSGLGRQDVEAVIAPRMAMYFGDGWRARPFEFGDDLWPTTRRYKWQDLVA